ncbi:MAG: NAD(P)-binding protein [Bryobacterales bacterium]|nr:NAD(P)-binding protein [Bryobacterales bacterium]
MTLALDKAKVAIIGAGPAGLGAAWRLQELGFENWTLFEKETYPGGLAASFSDAAGFTWDIGGHVQFSHYPYFDNLMDRLLGSGWLRHKRESWIWIGERFVPYPFQHNIRHLPRQEMRDCLEGLIRARTESPASPPANFEEWILGQFGEGIARQFMLPYNYKVWGCSPRELNCRWIGERVAKVDLERVVFNLLDARDDLGWGPNDTFRFPLHGGTGAIWTKLAGRLPPERLVFGKRLRRLDATRRVLHFQDGSEEDYDILISTAPLDWLVRRSDLEDLKDAAGRLAHSSTHVVGIGLAGEPPEHLRSKTWMYFPESHTPFYRATVYSNYSPNNVPDIRRFWSLMLEVSESPAKPVDDERLVDSVIDGLLSARLIEDQASIVDVWRYRAEYGYPTPTLSRDEALGILLPALDELGIFSRGRFGAWKYEVSNQDHSLMQGVELVDRLAAGSQERTLGVAVPPAP